MTGELGHLTSEGALAVSRALGAMPYSGLDLRGPRHGDPYTVELLVENLATLAATLRDVAARHDADTAELTAYRRDVAAMRRLLGTGGAQ